MGATGVDSNSSSWKLLSAWSRGPAWHLVLPIVAMIAAGLAVTAIYLPHAMRSAALEAAYRSGIQVADLIKIARGYYTQNVIPKALASNVLHPSDQHKILPNAIPLPATFVKDISDLLQEKDTSLALVSPYPWPHRSQRKMDDFESNAWDAIQRDPASVFSRLEVRDGKRVLRIAVADRMTAETCVNCHNAHPQSVKRDWKVGDVRAVMQVSKIVEPYLAAVDHRSRTIVWSLVGVGAIVAGLLIGFAALVTRRNREKQASDSYIRFMAHHDAMTGLLNRVSFIEALDRRLGDISEASRLAVYFIDLDRFKEVNDRFGHGAGDQLVQAVAGRLRGLIGRDDLLARLGGDEFAIVQIDVGANGDINAFATKIVQMLSKPFALEKHQVCISASVGAKLATYPAKASSDLLQAADIALYRAKAAGRDQAVVFSPEMRAELHERRELEQWIRSACETYSFELYFQPIRRVADGRLQGFEALLRLPKPEGGMIPPNVFIPIAEEIGLIGKIGSWVIAQACAAASSWPDQLSVAINLSPMQFGAARDGGRPISAVVASALEASGLAPHRLDLEITESLLIEDTESVMVELRRLKELGITLVMDDFGTGYSSLSYLWKLPFDKIKIDRSFIAASSAANPNAILILKTITALGRTLNMKIVAEGIETKEQADLFAALDCDQMQGFYFGNPMPGIDVAAFVLADHQRQHVVRPKLQVA